MSVAVALVVGVAIGILIGIVIAFLSIAVGQRLADMARAAEEELYP